MVRFVCKKVLKDGNKLTKMIAKRHRSGLIYIISKAKKWQPLRRILNDADACPLVRSFVHSIGKPIEAYRVTMFCAPLTSP